VANGVIDPFEVINIREDDAEGEAVTFEIVKARLELHFEIAPVRQACQLIDEGGLLQASDGLPIGKTGRIVLEDLGGANDP
jgi:hypothetical protein